MHAIEFPLLAAQLLVGSNNFNLPSSRVVDCNSPTFRLSRLILDLISVLRDNVEPMAAKTSDVPKVRLGSQGLEVSAQGLGCMGTVWYPELEGDMEKLIQYAVDEGITFLDTSDVYGPYTNEILVGKVCMEQSPTFSFEFVLIPRP